MAREAQPKFPKKPPANPAVFFRPSPAGRCRKPSRSPIDTTELPELMNLPHAH
ncbi:hypothetical protein [Burkholderia cenocepacia]|uniref:hypothetical protein n=1 Tax=Burkholderia cenocepacia TaxID=95486 RepID=UPI0013E047E4|nr:hypothetical protein [Burkholderia cenocepacia]